MKTCDNTSVGIVITDRQGRYMMFDRAAFPPGSPSCRTPRFLRSS
ncbi:hypothetical protein ACLMNJ_14100 [Streptomyces seoulensis]